MVIRMPRFIIPCVIAVFVMCRLPSPLSAGQPTPQSLRGAIENADFSGCLTDAAAWLNAKTPNRPDESALTALLKDPAFLAVLDQRQLIAKTGVDQLGSFARADKANREFLESMSSG